MWKSAKDWENIETAVINAANNMVPMTIWVFAAIGGFRHIHFHFGP